VPEAVRGGVLALAESDAAAGAAEERP
jgi:hypothetical protein